MKPPVYLIDKINTSPVDELWKSIEWETRDAPRRECWMTDTNEEYTYGSGRGIRTYQPKEWHPEAKSIQTWLKDYFGYVHEGCFINGYENEKQHLGWHSDDSPEMDDSRSIVVVSFGAERYIHFRQKGMSGRAEHIEFMPHGSLLVMPAGMQVDWDHKIPKHSAPCGPRISFTYRGIL